MYFRSPLSTKQKNKEDILGMRIQSYKTTALKWVGFVTAVWVSAISGTNYTFSDYSDALKSLMELTQVELNGLSVAKDVGKAFGILAGLCSDRFPTWVLLLIGCIEGFVGFGVQWLVVSQIINPLPYLAMCIFVLMGGNSVAWYNTAVLVTCIRNFRTNRGPASGILKAFVGLSAAIFTDLCESLFSDSSSAFLLMCTIIPSVVCFTAMIFMREIPQASLTITKDSISKESNYFLTFNILSIFVALYLLAYDFVGSQGTAFNIGFSSILIVLLAFPLAIPGYICVRGWFESRDDPVLDPVSLLVDNEDSEVEDKEVPESVEIVERLKPEIGEDHTVFEALMTLEFWVLSIAFLVGVGPGMMVMNNMGQMGSALGYSDVSIFVSLLSVTGFFGRIIAGTVTEYCIMKASIPRPIFNFASQIPMAIAFALMAVAVPGCLYIGSCIVGFCFGVRLTISIPLSSELFGLKYYGIIYNVIVINLPISSLFFSGLLAGYLYDAEATTTSTGENECYGAHCYRLCFFIFVGMCIVGAGLDVWLSLMTREVYKKIGASKRSKV